MPQLTMEKRLIINITTTKTRLYSRLENLDDMLWQQPGPACRAVNSGDGNKSR